MPQSLQDIKKAWSESLPQTFVLLGRSSCSILPATFSQGRLEDAALKEIRRAWACELAELQEEWKSAPEEGQCETFFRMSSDLPVVSSHGAQFKKVAGASARAWLDTCKRNNHRFLNAVYHKTKHVTYKAFGKEVNVWSNAQGEIATKANVFSSAFGYAALQVRDFTSSSTHDNYNTVSSHVDGGPSSIFLAITLEGSRLFEIEDKDGNSIKVKLGPGSWYVSSPSAYWHKIKKADSDSCTVLVLRSGFLERRYSGGTVNAKGKRTCGWIQGSRIAFETVMPRIHTIMMKEPFQMAGLTSTPMPRRIVGRPERNRNVLRYSKLRVSLAYEGAAWTKADVLDHCSGKLCKIKALESQIVDQEARASARLLKRKVTSLKACAAAKKHCRSKRARKH